MTAIISQLPLFFLSLYITNAYNLNFYTCITPHKCHSHTHAYIDRGYASLIVISFRSLFGFFRVGTTQFRLVLLVTHYVLTCYYNMSIGTSCVVSLSLASISFLWIFRCSCRIRPTFVVPVIKRKSESTRGDKEGIKYLYGCIETEIISEISYKHTHCSTLHKPSTNLTFKDTYALKSTIVKIYCYIGMHDN